MEHRGASSSIVAVLFVVGILVGAAGYYFVTTRFFPTSASSSSSTSTWSHSTTPATSQSSTRASSTTICPASEPLTLISASVTPSASDTYDLLTVWSNCSNQKIQFNVDVNSINATFSLYGNNGKITSGFERGCHVEPVCGTVDAHGTTTVEVLIGNQVISPNAINVVMSGSAVALDPITYQAISLPTPFTT